MGTSVLTHPAKVLAFRQSGRNFRQPLLFIFISILASQCSANDFEDIADFGQQKQAVLVLPHGIPSAGTFQRVFHHLDAQTFNQALLSWMRCLLPASVAEQVCVDGQTLRGTGPQALYLVSALARIEGLCLAQMAMAGTGQELAAVPEVLALLDLSGGGAL